MGQAITGTARDTTSRTARNIRSVSDLGEVLAELRALRARPRVRLELSGIESARARAIEDRLNHLASDCGCTLGSVFMAASLAAYALATLAAANEWRWEYVIWGVAIALGAALAGKALAIQRARVRMIRECEQLLVRLDLMGPV